MSRAKSRRRSGSGGSRPVPGGGGKPRPTSSLDDEYPSSDWGIPVEEEPVYRSRDAAGRPIEVQTVIVSGLTIGMGHRVLALPGAP